MLEVVISILLGAAIGSFLTMLTYRLPHMINQSGITLLSPKRSMCTHCHHTLEVMQLIPIVSYIVQKGKCTHCGAPISPLYFSIEAITIVTTLALYLIVGLEQQLLFWLLLTYGSIVLFFTDWTTRLAPDVITLPLIVVGVLFQYLYGDIQASIIGMLVGYYSLWSVYHIHKLLSGREGMGYGDFKVFAMIGAWLGWYALSYIMLIACGIAIGYYFLWVRNSSVSLPLASFMVLALPIYEVVALYEVMRVI